VEWREWEEPNIEVIRQALSALGVRRVAELREYGPDFLLDLHLMAPQYTGAEGIWADESLSWIAYASHEGTVAFGGTLAESIEWTWPDLDAWSWTSWSDERWTGRASVGPPRTLTVAAPRQYVGKAIASRLVAATIGGNVPLVH